MPKQKLDLVHASVGRIKSLKADIASMTRMLENDQRSAHPKIQDPAEYKADVAKKQKELDDHSPRKATGEAANKLNRLQRELGKKIQERMPRSRDYFRKHPKGENHDDFDFERAVEQQVAFQRNTQLQYAIRVWKYARRCLEPDNPEITNIERLRR